MEPVVKTKRLELKAMSGTDRETLAEMLLNDEIKKTYMIPDFAEPEALERMITVFMDLSASADHFTRGIYLDGALIGFVNDVEMESDRIELGYVIHPNFWGRGYATEMLEAVIAKLLGNGFLTIKAGAFCENAASIRVMEKCGMKQCPRLEQIEYRGINHTCVYYEIKAKG